MPNLNRIKTISTALTLGVSALLMTACGGGAGGFGESYDIPEFEPEPTLAPTTGPEPTPMPILSNIQLDLGDGYDEFDLTNSHLEDGATDPWSTNGTLNLSVVSNDVRDGMYSMLASGKSSGWQGPAYSLIDPDTSMSILEADTVYKLAVSVKLNSAADGATQDTIKVTLKTGDNSYTGLTGDGVPVTTDAWTDITAEFLASDYSAETSQIVYIESAGGTSSYLVDALMIGKKLPDALDLPNGDLETGETAPWSQQGLPATGLAVTDEEAYEGDYSLKITGRTAGWNAPTYSVIASDGNVSLAPDTQYIASAWVKMDSIGLSDEQLAAFATERDENPDEDYPDESYDKVSITLKGTPKASGEDGSDYTNVATSLVTENGWVLVRGTFNTGESDTATERVLYIEAAGATSSYYVDNFKIRPVNGTVEVGE